MSGSSPLVLAEIALAGDGAAVPLDAEHHERAVLPISGAVTIDGARFPTGHLAVLEPGRPVVLGGHGTAMVLGGEPVGPRRIWWNFVHGDPERIEEAKAEWREQRFPSVPGDHAPWVPLPE